MDFSSQNRRLLGQLFVDHLLLSKMLLFCASVRHASSMRLSARFTPFRLGAFS